MRILCFGDSNTFGYDPRSWFGERYPADGRWVDILAEKTGWQVLNRGQNGREIPHRPRELEQTVRSLAANTPLDVLVVMLGTNDLLQGNAPPATCQRMEIFLSRVRPLCGRLLLVAPPAMKRGAWVEDASLVSASEELARGYRALADRMEICFADGAAWNVDIAYDGVHFSEAGHRAFAEGIHEALRKR